jgi:hypothetical protein
VLEEQHEPVTPGTGAEEVPEDDDRGKRHRAGKYGGYFLIPYF